MALEDDIVASYQFNIDSGDDANLVGVGAEALVEID